ncbi:MAG: TIGR04255 family protein [Thermoanaerobaculia bacterium]|nr:TIGR04255 family protein [Thermoanaerobaculia bacterium]
MVPLPDFERPPLVEVAVGFQFDPLPLNSLHLGDIWGCAFRERFPVLQPKPALQPSFERFGVAPGQPQLRLLVNEQVPMRAWLLSETEDQLLQLQRDRFHFNWKRTDSGGAYPRFEWVVERFLEHLETLRSHLERNEVALTPINQCEVVYVNHIHPAEGVWDTFSQAGNAVPFAEVPNLQWLRDPENVEARARFVMTDGNGVPIGRLHAELEPLHVIGTQSPLLGLKMIARGTPVESTPESAQEFFELAREWIVRGFVDLTSPEMHRVWGRTDA